MPDTATDRPVRLLHLSDLQFRADRAWDADPVLRDLVQFIRAEVAAGLIANAGPSTGRACLLWKVIPIRGPVPARGTQPGLNRDSTGTQALAAAATGLFVSTTCLSASIQSSSS